MNPKDEVIQFGKHIGKSYGYLLKNQYHYCKWLLNQPTSKNAKFEKARTFINALLKDDEFVSELANCLPDTKPNHDWMVPKEEQLPFIPKKMPVVPNEINLGVDGIDFMLISRIISPELMPMEYATDVKLVLNFKEKFEVDEIDTMLILRKEGGKLTLENYKFVSEIADADGEVNLWQN